MLSSTIMARRSWIPLPTEIIEKILLYMSPRELVETREVSRMFRGVIEGSLLLMARLYGYDLGPGGAVSSGSRENPTRRNLDSLKEHIHRRFMLNWSRATFRVPFFEHASLVDGLLIALGLQKVICVELPSTIRGTSYRLWTQDLGFQPIKFACDPAQNILILLEFVPQPGDMAMHVCRLFESARRRPGPPIRPRSGIRFEAPLDIQVLGDLFGVLVSITRPQAGTLLEVYDWKRGEFRAHFMCSVKTDSFCFIAQNLIILPHYPEDARAPLELLLLDFAREDTGEGIVVARFQFPGQGPFPRPAIRVFGFALPRSNAPFVASRRVRIVWDDSSLGSPPSFWPIEVLMDPLSFLSFAPSTRSPTLSPNTVPWDRWGKDAQLIPEMKYRYGLRRVHPTRTAHLEIHQPVVINNHDPSEPSLTGDRALVMGVRVVEFGRIGLSPTHTTTARSATVEDKNTSVSSYYPLPKPLRGNTVAHLTNTLQISKPLHEFYVHEYRILSDEERIVVLERPYASDPNDGVERRWGGIQTLTVFIV